MQGAEVLGCRDHPSRGASSLWPWLCTGTGERTLRADLFPGDMMHPGGTNSCPKALLGSSMQLCSSPQAHSHLTPPEACQVPGLHQAANSWVSGASELQRPYLRTNVIIAIRDIAGPLEEEKGGTGGPRRPSQLCLCHFHLPIWCPAPRVT